MKTSLLSEKKFRGRFAAPMRDVTKDATGVIDIWPYVDPVPSEDLQGHQVYDRFVEYIYRDATGRFDHVQVMTRTKNVYLVVVVNLRRNMIHGHCLLDLNKKYGIATGGER